MSIVNGVYNPPDVGLLVPLTFPGALSVVARMESCERFAGASIGSAVVRYSTEFAEDATPGMGEEARITIGGETVFRGVVGDARLVISDGEDEVQLVLYDDKWLMDRMVIGQYGIGTVDSGESGFKYVGFDFTFNPQGRPNKLVGSFDFDTSTSAEFWTLKTILQFIFTHYIDSSCAIISLDGMGDEWDRKPSHLNLIGQTALQAVDNVVALAGQSWGLNPGADKSRFTIVKRNYGALRTVHLFSTKSGRKATEATELHASSISVNTTIRNSRDVHQVFSGPMRYEIGLTSTGSDPLLVMSSSPIKGYSKRFTLDIAQYETYGLGQNPPTGGKPKPWLKELLTRISGGAYVTAAQIAANPALLDAERAQIPIWIAADKTKPATARLVVGGARIDCENCCIDLADVLDVMKNTAEIGADKKDRKELTIEDWDDAGVWMTVAMQLETRDVFESDTNSKYLPEEFYVVTTKEDLIPEKRCTVWLPDLAGDNNAISALAATEEAYYDVAALLEEACDSSVESMPLIETPIELRFGFFPVLNIGDRISVSGRDVGATGDEVITQVMFNIHESFETRVTATNVMAAVNPEEFVK